MPQLQIRASPKNKFKLRGEHLNPHAKCRSSKFNLKLFKKRKTEVTYNLETLTKASDSTFCGWCVCIEAQYICFFLFFFCIVKFWYPKSEGERIHILGRPLWPWLFCLPSQMGTAIKGKSLLPGGANALF